jgi:hypothetical protein
MEKKPEPGSAWKRPEIDPTKRYDVYVSEPQRQVVYRNVLLMAAMHLLGTDVADRAPRFIQLEQANGQSVYVPRGAIVKVCEHGVVLTHEDVAVKNSHVR